MTLLTGAVTAGICREQLAHLAWLVWWFLLWSIWTSAASGWQSILQRAGHTERGNFWKLCALQLFRGGLLLVMSCIENAGIQTPPHWLLPFSELVASVSFDVSAAGPRTSYTNPTNFCSLRRIKGSVFWASSTHILGGSCAEWDLCYRLGQGLHTHLVK